ncbi:hypothetical protein [uncultured Arcobacter sp.]|uniref:hypothetical protein n=1 Tax=uncultured Arcobacter sp. TaxID=165434 RepID=UPI002621F527|nr:hypothetical protein [uncultured Arcobacter sp.]
MNKRKYESVYEDYIELLDSGICPQDAIIQLSEDYDCALTTIQRDIRRAKSAIEAKEYSEQAEEDGHFVKAKSTLYKDGQKVLEWVKTDINKDILHQKVQKAIKELIQEAEGIYEPIPYEFKEPANKDLTVFFPIADSHWGMLAHAEETGQDYDLKIAEEWFEKATNYLIETSPNAQECVICDLGDFLHSSNDENRSRSGHALDTDSRHHKTVKTAFKCMVRLCDKLLKKYEKVHFYSVAGNHSEYANIYLQSYISAWFNKEDRLIVHESPAMQQYHRVGKVILGFTHGHMLKANRAGETFAFDNQEYFSESKFRYFHFGHEHTNKTFESPICVVEHHKNLTPNDSWSASQGYRGYGEVKAILYNSNYGEIGRIIFNTQMLNMGD